MRINELNPGQLFLVRGESELYMKTTDSAVSLLTGVIRTFSESREVFKSGSMDNVVYHKILIDVCCSKTDTYKVDFQFTKCLTTGDVSFINKSWMQEYL